MGESPSLESVCGILVTDNAVGAQTERQGDAEPVSALLGGEEFTGRLIGH
jgi:hypothetical protein